MAERPPQSRHDLPQRRPLGHHPMGEESGRQPNDTRPLWSSGGMGQEALKAADRTSHGDPIQPTASDRPRHAGASSATGLRGRWDRAGEPLGRVLRRLRHQLGWLWGQDGSPGHRARGLAAGVFTGCLPFFGLQIVLGVALAAAIRGNRILAAAGTWISNPLTTLPICWVNYQLGVLLIGPGPAWPEMEGLDPERIGALGWAFSSRLLLGSVVIGASAALVTGVACWRWLHQRERRNDHRNA